MMKERFTIWVRGDDPHSKVFNISDPSSFVPRPIKSYWWQKGELETLLLLARRNQKCLKYPHHVRIKGLISPMLFDKWLRLSKQAVRNLQLVKLPDKEPDVAVLQHANASNPVLVTHVKE